MQPLQNAPRIPQGVPVAPQNRQALNQQLQQLQNLGLPNRRSNTQLTNAQKTALKSKKAPNDKLTGAEIACLVVMTVTCPFLLVMGSFALIGAFETGLGGLFSIDRHKSVKENLSIMKEMILYGVDPFWNIKIKKEKSSRDKDKKMPDYDLNLLGPFALVLSAYMLAYQKGKENP